MSKERVKNTIFMVSSIFHVPVQLRLLFKQQKKGKGAFITVRIPVNFTSPVIRSFIEFIGKMNWNESLFNKRVQSAECEAIIILNLWNRKNVNFLFQSKKFQCKKERKKDILWRREEPIPIHISFLLYNNQTMPTFSNHHLTVDRPIK